MSLIGNFVKPNCNPPALYSIDDLKAFRYHQESSDVGELQAFSGSMQKWISLDWFNRPNGLAEEDNKTIEHDLLVKKINQIKEQNKQC
jgi:hypothetical protein